MVKICQIKIIFHHSILAQQWQLTQDGGYNSNSYYGYYAYYFETEGNDFEKKFKF